MKTIESLFGPNAQRVKAYPLQFIFRVLEEGHGNSPVQVSFSVPKRRFRKAIQRNYYKRRLREAYRLHKDQLVANLTDHSPQIALMVLLAGPPPANFKEMTKAMQKGLGRLSREIDKAAG